VCGQEWTGAGEREVDRKRERGMEREERREETTPKP